MRVMCTGRVDLAFILRALANGKDGVFIGGCWPGECHYITEGNYLALATLLLGRRLLALIGIAPERLRLEWISASEGSRYAEVMNDFSNQIKTLGPLGDEVDAEVLAFRLRTLQSMIPYIKLVERERLRVHAKSVESYEAFYGSAAFERLFQELIADKLAICQMMDLLRDKPRTKVELAAVLGLPASELARHVNVAARQGLCRFDEHRQLIAAAFDGDPAAADRPGDDVRPAALSDAGIARIIDAHQGRPGALIHVLMEIQGANHWLPKEILDTVSRKLEVPLSRVMQIASFYKTFSLTPKGRHRIHVCTGTACHLRGADRLLDSVQSLIGIRPGELDADSTFSLETGSCQGCCTLGPEIIVDGRHHGRVSPDGAEAVLKTYA